MAYRCSFCGIIFDSISHRERHEQRHKVSSCKSLALFAFGVKCQGYAPYCSLRTTTHLNAKTATRCSKTRRTWDTTTKLITSFRIRKGRQHLESKSLLLQIRFGRILLRQEKNIFHFELSNLDFACIYFYMINPTRKATRKTRRTLRSTLATCVTSLSCLPSLHSGTWGSVCWGWALINTDQIKKP